MTQHFSFFVPDDLDLWSLTLTFELGGDFCTTYLITKFGSYHADKQTNKQTPLKTFTALRYATPVGNNLAQFRNTSRVLLSYKVTKLNFIHQSA